MDIAIKDLKHEITSLKGKVKEDPSVRQRLDECRDRLEELLEERASQERIKRQKLENKEKERRRQNIFELGIPKLGHRKINYSTTQKVSKSKRYKGPRRSEEVPLVRIERLDVSRAGGYTELFRQAKQGWEGEASIASLLERVFGDQIFQALPTDGRDSLRVTREIERLVAKRSQRPDLLVVREAQNDPIGVIKVKIPLYAQLGDERVGTLEKKNNIKQIRGYLNRLKAFDGVVHAFGILSNYEEFRFCWFEESTALVAATTQYEARLAIATSAAPSNNLCLSRIYRFDESDTALRLAGRVWRMQYGLSARREKKQFKKSKPETIDLVLSKTELKWIVNAHATPTSVKVGEWVLWRYLGQGASGAVWEAYEQQKVGKSKKRWSVPFALKLLFEVGDDEDATHNINNEIEAWKRLDRAVKSHTLNKKEWLQMPLYAPLPENIAEDKIRVEIVRLASSGIRHLDLEWRHVLYDQSCEEVRIVDFGYCEIFDPNDRNAVEECTREMWKELCDVRNATL